MTETLQRQPAIYIPHGGGPWPFMDDPQGRWKELDAYLAALPASLPRRPNAIASLVPTGKPMSCTAS